MRERKNAVAIAMNNRNASQLDTIQNKIDSGELGGNSTPSGVYDSLLALQADLPTGADGTYVTTDNGHWYFWNSTWLDGGVYQSDGISDNSIYEKMLEFSEYSSNLFDKTKATLGKELQLYSTVDSAEYHITDYIPVVDGDTIYADVGAGSVYFWYYDASKTKLYANNTFNPTQRLPFTVNQVDVAFIRFNFKQVRLNNLVVSKTIINKYEPHALIKLSSIQNVSSNVVNFWEGKNGDSLGDSITGQDNRGITFSGFQTWTRYFFNMNTFFNNGAIGGTKLTGTPNEFGASMWEDSRISALNPSADFITVMGGTNDGNVTIGDVSLTNVDTDTYIGALNVIISKIYTKYSGLIDIIIMTPTYVSTETTDRIINQSQACRDVARLWGLTLCDLNANSKMNSGTKDICFGTDKIHPLEVCHKEYIAPILIDTLNKMQRIDYTKLNYVLGS